MLQALLADRFKLVAHLDTQEHPVLGLVVGKGGVKLKESTVVAVPIDENAPLKPGEMKMDTPDGPARMTRNPDGSGTVNMGARGTFTQKMDGQNLRIEASTITMAGFADMLTQMMQIGGASTRQVVDMTGLKGNYQVAVELSLADLIASGASRRRGCPQRPRRRRWPRRRRAGRIQPIRPQRRRDRLRISPKTRPKTRIPQSPNRTTHHRPRRKDPHRQLK